ncbi:MAG: alpha-hydroxy acid oxidase [Pseudomonadota bacterium]
MNYKKCHNVMSFHELARRRLPWQIYHYLQGGADDLVTMERSLSAYDEYELLPNYLVDVSEIDTTTTVLGETIQFPVMISPTGGTGMFHYDGEKAVARAADKAGIMYSLSTVGTTSIEDVAEICKGPKMFQVYPSRDHKVAMSFIERSREAGFTSICLTVDTPVSGNREMDLVTEFPRFTPRAILSLIAHPRWSLSTLLYGKLGPANFAQIKHVDAEGKPTAPPPIPDMFDPSINWARAAEMVQAWDGPFAIKGILSVDDAKRAVDIGASAVIVSNHGGRQLDGVPATIDCLSPIVKAVGHQLEVILDGGVRRGTHVIKALALGAKACMIGRPYLYGLAAAGQAGVERVLELFQTEIRRNMVLLGACEINDIDRRFIRHRLKEL